MLLDTKDREEICDFISLPRGSSTPFSSKNVTVYPERLVTGYAVILEWEEEKSRMAKGFLPY